MDPVTILTALVAGAVIGLILSLVGGGGSILAVPLLVYGVGVSSTHEAIGTAAVAVTLSALSGLVAHARAGTVKWPCAIVFGVAGIVGAAAGAELGKAMDGEWLLALFGLLMVAVGVMMFRPRQSDTHPDVHLDRETASHLLPRLLPAGFGTGTMAGFFGIGGGFLIVPGLMAATAMPMAIAIGSSLVVVVALGTTTAVSYAVSGYVDWSLVAIMLAGGIAGGLAGRAMGSKLSRHGRALETGFAILVAVVGLGIVASAYQTLIT